MVTAGEKTKLKQKTKSKARTGRGNCIKKKLPVRSEICCGLGQYHGFAVRHPLLWMWLSCHWYGRLRNCLCWQSWKHRTCCWGWLRSHLLADGGGAEDREQLRREQLRRNSNSSTQQIAIFITFITLTSTLGWLGQKAHYIKNKIRIKKASLKSI